MASVYLDTSALLKLYVEEDGTERVACALEKAEDGRIVILDLAPLEAPLGDPPARTRGRHRECGR